MNGRFAIVFLLFLIVIQGATALTEYEVVLENYGSLPSMSVCGSTPLGYGNMIANDQGGVTFVDFYGQVHACPPGLNSTTGLPSCTAGPHLGGSCFNARPVATTSCNEGYVFFAHNQWGPNGGAQQSCNSDFSSCYTIPPIYKGIWPMVSTEYFIFFFNGDNLTRCEKDWGYCAVVGNYTGKNTNSFTELNNGQLFFQFGTTDFVFLDAWGYPLRTYRDVNISSSISKTIDMGVNDSDLYFLVGAGISHFDLASGNYTSPTIIITSGYPLVYSDYDVHRYSSDHLVFTSKLWNYTVNASLYNVIYKFCDTNLVCGDLHTFDVGLPTYGLKTAVSSEGLNFYLTWNNGGAGTQMYIRQTNDYVGANDDFICPPFEVPDIYQGFICSDGVQNDKCDISIVAPSSPNVKFFEHYQNTFTEIFTIDTQKNITNAGIACRWENCYIKSVDGYGIKINTKDLNAIIPSAFVETVDLGFSSGVDIYPNIPLFRDIDNDIAEEVIWWGSSDDGIDFSSFICHTDLDLTDLTCIDVNLELPFGGVMVI